MASSDHSNWFRIVCTDRPESSITLNSNLSRNSQEVAGNCHLPDSVPIVGIIALDRSGAKLELRSGHSGVFLPDILGCGCASGDLGVDARPEDGHDRRKRTFLAEAQADLPVEVPVGWKFKLSADPTDSRRKVGYEASVGDGKQPVNSLSPSCHVILNKLEGNSRSYIERVAARRLRQKIFIGPK